jgi:hypothetical protein
MRETLAVGGENQAEEMMAQADLVTLTTPFPAAGCASISVGQGQDWG